MIGKGRGEQLTDFPLTGIDYGQVPADEAAVYEVQVLTPQGVAVSTADAYRGIKPMVPELALEEVLAKPVEQWDGLLVNDFEMTVFDKHPELAAIKHSLYESGAVYASMSGSGSALFALYRK
jgi:4-diphosphocytidyl-2-C-methyl-D-erythritol kinase